MSGLGPARPRDEETRQPSQAPLLVSACLAGVHCRYDGRSKADPRIARLVQEGRAIPVCPEQLGGLSTPREPVRFLAGPERRLITESGADVTDAYRRGAAEALRLARLAGARRAVLKERSPSCGTHLVWEQESQHTEPRLVEGEGVTARLLREAGLEVASEATWDGE